MIFRIFTLLATVVLTFAVGLAGDVVNRSWRPLPANLWAQVAFVPPGTNNVPRTDVLPDNSAQPPVTPAPVSSAPVSPAQVSPAQVSAPPAESGAAPQAGGVPPTHFPTTLPPGVPRVGAGAGSSTAGVVPVIGSVPATAGSTGGISPQQQPQTSAPRLPANCKAVLEKAEASVGSTGGPVRFAAQFTPPACATEPVSTVAWILKSATPARTSGFMFTVEPNSSRTSRRGALIVGDVTMTVLQAAGKTAAFAAAPSRVELSAGGKQPLHKQTITAWSDDVQAGFKAKTTAGWLKVAPAPGGRRPGPQKFVVELATGGLQPGRHAGAVEITSPGSVNEPLRIPVVVTVGEKPAATANAAAPSPAK